MKLIVTTYHIKAYFEKDKKLHVIRLINKLSNIKKTLISVK